MKALVENLARFWRAIIGRIRTGEWAMEIHCAWCQPQKFLRYEPTGWRSAGTQSHGICDDCCKVHFPQTRVRPKCRAVAQC